MERIGGILRDRRKDKKLSQKYVALQANISNSYLWILKAIEAIHQ